MLRIRRLAVYGWIGTVLCLGHADAQEEAAKSPWPTPEFKKEKSAAAFAEGKKLFEAGDYKKAERAFRKSKSGAKGREDKKTVEIWTAAAKGSRAVSTLEKLVKVKQHSKALREAERLMQLYAQTPAKGIFSAFIDELGKTLFVSVEGFEVRSARYSQKKGKFFEADPQKVFRGTQCLRWTNTQDRKAAVLKIDAVPKDWSGFEAVEFWIRGPQLPSAIEAAVATGKLAKKNEVQEAFLLAVPLPKNGDNWTKVRLDLSKNRVVGKPSLKSVIDFRLQIRAGATFEIHLDEIVAVRKEPLSATSEKPPQPRR